MGLLGTLGSGASQPAVIYSPSLKQKVGIKTQKIKAEYFKTSSLTSTGGIFKTSAISSNTLNNNTGSVV